SGWAHGPPEGPALWEDALDALLELTGATAGWVGVYLSGQGGQAGRLTFPVRRGAFSQSWLTLQQGEAGAWGFAPRAGPSMANALPRLPRLGAPPLRNLLACPFGREGTAGGQVVLANKPAGFTSYDTLIVQTAAFLLGKQTLQAAPPPHVPVPLPL